MSNGFFNLGQAILGGDIDREGARLEGLELGTRIRSRAAATEKALAEARARQAQNIALENLADAIGLGGAEAIAGSVQAGANPEQVVAALAGQQTMDFRDVIADVLTPRGERQAAAQAIEGKVVDPVQFGPGGELFVDVFSNNPCNRS